MKIFTDNFKKLDWRCQLLQAKTHCDSFRRYQTQRLQEFADAARDFACDKDHTAGERLAEAGNKVWSWFKYVFECAYGYNKLREEFRRSKNDPSCEYMKKIGCPGMGYFNPFKFALNVCVRYENGLNGEGLRILVYDIMDDWAERIRDQFTIVNYKYVYWFHKALSSGVCSLSTPEGYIKTPATLDNMRGAYVRVFPSRRDACIPGMEYSYYVDKNDKVQMYLPGPKRDHDLQKSDPGGFGMFERDQ